MRRLLTVGLIGLGLAIPGPGTGEPVPALAPAAATQVSGVTGDEPRPLLIVLDTSGSMAEDDGAGTIKLAGAQAALARMIRNQRPGANVGLWTYPSSGDCGPGQSSIDVSPLNQTEMIDTVQELTADGDTPTAEALRAAVDSLKGTYDGATLLLISDGQSTCGDPCATAEEIVAEGFDLTVEAAGFNISDDGYDELRCIAEATGGAVHEATSSEELDEIVAATTTAELAVTVEGMPSRIPAGAARRVTVNVENTSAIDVENARIAFSFTNQDDVAGQAIVPSVLPPRLSLGNIAAGQSAAHTWLVSFGSRGKSGTATYRISGWGRNANPMTVAGTVEVTADHQDLDDAGGLLAGLRGKRIAILGDSYSSGEGAPPFQKGTTGSLLENKCHKSDRTYLKPLFSDVELLACSGATTYRSGWPVKKNGVVEEQVPLLRDVQDDHGAVYAGFMTIGGNDIGFGTIVKECLLGHLDLPNATWDTRCADDPGLLADIQRKLADLPKLLEPTYREVSGALNTEERVRERDGEPAPLYVLAYPQAFPEQQWAYWCGKEFDAHEIAFANRLLNDLNRVIEKSVAEVRSQGYPVQMITATQETFLPDNTVCARPGTDPFMIPVDAVTGVVLKLTDLRLGTTLAQLLMHPNVLGYAAETDTIISWSQSDNDTMPEELRDWKLMHDPGWVSQIPPRMANYASAALPTATAQLDATRSTWSGVDDLRAGQELEVEVTHAAPNSLVPVTMASSVRLIGSVLTDERGSGTATMRVPVDLEPGGHRLEAMAFDQDGNPAFATTEVDVSRALPWWLLPVLLGTVLLFAAWVLLGRRARKRGDVERL